MSKDTLKHRLENFKAELIDDPYGLPDEKYLRVTHNGFQWSGFSLLPEEMLALRDLLNKELGDE